jgi:hypothetical protein
MKISDASGKLVETHHLIYSVLMTRRLGQGIWNLKLEMPNSKNFDTSIFIQ